jgi:hypothetical protein
MLRETHPLGRHAVDVWRGKKLLPVAAKVAVPGVVHHNANYIRAVLVSFGSLCFQDSPMEEA